MPSVQSSSQNKTFVNTKSRKIAIKFSRGALFHMKTRVSIKYFVTDCSRDSHEIDFRKPKCLKKVYFALY